MQAATAAAAGAVAAGVGTALAAAPVSPRLPSLVAAELAPPAEPPPLPTAEAPCAACAARVHALARAAAAPLSPAASPASPASSPAKAPAASASGAPPPRASSLPAGKFTICDVRAHTTAASLWLTANGRVYDVTSWLSKHPGGPGALLSHGGRDADEDYAFHRLPTQALWEQTCIGRLVPCDARKVVQGSFSCAVA